MSEEALKVDAKLAGQPKNILGVITQAVENYKDLDVNKMERLLSMYERLKAEERRAEFAQAMSTLQASLPRIEKRGVNAFTKTPYALYEDLDTAIKPCLVENGFSLSFNEESREGLLVRFSIRATHRNGHYEERFLTVSTDEAAKNSRGTATRTATQDDGSTTAYARRYLVKMLLNLVEVGEDTDGAGEAGECITEDQAKDIQALIDEVKADTKRFLKYAKVESISKIRKGDFERIIKKLEDSRRRK